MKTIEFYHDIFTPQAGGVISQQLLAGESNSLSSLEKIAQIPDSSWLWKRIFTVLLAQLDTTGRSSLSGQNHLVIRAGSAVGTFSR